EARPRHHVGKRLAPPPPRKRAALQRAARTTGGRHAKAAWASARFVLRCAGMQGDMDIVDPLIDDYLTRLAGSPDPVEAEMRRYADERDGFPIVGQVMGQLLSQLSMLAHARRMFEAGSGFGYSAFWFACALESGASVTLTDFDRENLDRARAW